MVLVMRLIIPYLATFCKCFMLKSMKRKAGPEEFRARRGGSGFAPRPFGVLLAATDVQYAADEGSASHDQRDDQVVRAVCGHQEDANGTGRDHGEPQD